MAQKPLAKVPKGTSKGPQTSPVPTHGFILENNISIVITIEHRRKPLTITGGYGSHRRKRLSMVGNGSHRRTPLVGMVPKDGRGWLTFEEMKTLAG